MHLRGSLQILTLARKLLSNLAHTLPPHRLPRVPLHLAKLCEPLQSLPYQKLLRKLSSRHTLPPHLLLLLLLPLQSLPSQKLLRKLSSKHTLPSHLLSKVPLHLA